MPIFNIVINIVNDYQIIIVPKLQEVRSPKKQEKDTGSLEQIVVSFVSRSQIFDKNPADLNISYQCLTNPCVCTRMFNAFNWLYETNQITVCYST